MQRISPDIIKWLLGLQLIVTYLDYSSAVDHTETVCENTDRKSSIKVTYYLTFMNSKLPLLIYFLKL